jgi:septal ring factor EnvC (AmiA/AmiB activator)
VADGKVVFAKPFRGFGNLLILDHGGGYYTLYAQARQLVKKVGEVVAAGDTVGISGFGDNKKIYFEIRQRGTPLNPLQWLKPRS